MLFSFRSLRVFCRLGSLFLLPEGDVDPPAELLGDAVDVEEAGVVYLEDLHHRVPAHLEGGGDILDTLAVGGHRDPDERTLRHRLVGPLESLTSGADGGVGVAGLGEVRLDGDIVEVGESLLGDEAPDDALERAGDGGVGQGLSVLGLVDDGPVGDAQVHLLRLA